MVFLPLSKCTCGLDYSTSTRTAKGSLAVFRQSPVTHLCFLRRCARTSAKDAKDGGDEHSRQWSGRIAGLVGIGVLILKEKEHHHTAEFSWSSPHIIGGCAAFKFECSISSVEGRDGDTASGELRNEQDGRGARG